MPEYFVRLEEASESHERDALRIASEHGPRNGTLFGNYLNGMRADRGLTQQELASRSGISTGAVSSFECGLRYPTYITLLKMAKGMGVHPAQLFPFIWWKDLELE